MPAVTAALAPVMPVRHAAPVRAAAASAVAKIRFVRNPTPLFRLKQPSNVSPHSSRHRPEGGQPGFAAWPPQAGGDLRGQAGRALLAVAGGFAGPHDAAGDPGRSA